MQMKKLKSLKDLMIDELKDIQNAEKQIIATLPKMQKKASNPELKSAFSEHLEQTREHVTRLEQVFDILGQKPQGKTCRAMQGIIEEAKALTVPRVYLYTPSEEQFYARLGWTLLERTGYGGKTVAVMAYDIRG